MEFTLSDSQPTRTSPRIGWRTCGAVVLLLAMALAIRLIQLDRLPWTDELYTTLAAQGWLAEGSPRVGDGIYGRAELYTILVAGSLKLFGDGLVAARVPSVIFGSLLVVAVFLWVRKVSSVLAAWIAALFVCFAPIAIQTSQFARFYALFGLTFWLAAIAIYALTERRLSWSVSAPLAVAAVAGLLLSLHLQELTLIGTAGLALWWACTTGLPWWWSQRGVAPRRFWLISAAIAGSLAVVAAIAVDAGFAAKAWSSYRYAPPHAASLSNAVWFYHLNLIERYPTLWPFLPLLALLAIAEAPKPALFCLIIFATSFVFLSFGGMKHFQYFYFALPFLSVIWALALARIWDSLRAFVGRSVDQGLDRIHPVLARPSYRAAVIALGILFLALSNGATARVLLKPFGLALQSDVNSVDWARARPLLEPWLEKAAVLLTPNDVFALYYLGRHDVGVSTNLVAESTTGAALRRGGRAMPDAAQFVVDPRTGRPVVGTPETVQLIVSCFPSGILISDIFKWRMSNAIPDSVADVVQSTMQPIELPEELRLRAYHWEHPVPTPRPDACASLPDIGGQRAPSSGQPATSDSG